ncbi:endonuclease/exonuclease/phosphatase family protein [Aliiroseovarius sp. F20344]|uniref:endonuclease/exonuclease/phosphatase family protein n=1 Tax=Aliiroseovarius sp. F20344 TaxID=2926414 RepID=UPI001FF2F482|nr:endonuclease/exonuclease/phosphatase family protein [Aliiroseovarius sp. F20344]MCK0141509.1 endonuclease/exonuclease/phosphatase family protein [Aliiroseovarius sp. F20344]
MIRPFLALWLILLPGMAASDSLRIATYHADLRKKGPGLLLRDILKEDPQIVALAKVIFHAQPDVLALQGFDYDLQGHALAAFQAQLDQIGYPMPHSFAAAPNTGIDTGYDLDGDGRLAEPGDAQSFGKYTGQGGMAVLSRVPIGQVRNFSDQLWKDIPNPLLPKPEEDQLPAPDSLTVLRLSSVAHWDVELRPENAPAFHLLTFHANTPVFDGPADRNGRRNHDEVTFWAKYLDGVLSVPAPVAPVIIAGNANLDPVDGDGRHKAISELLTHPKLQDPTPQSAGGMVAADQNHQANPAFDTVDWPDGKPGNLRVSYVLPDARLQVTDSGVIWPTPDDPFAQTVETASRHRLVWVDIDF